MHARTRTSFHIHRLTHGRNSGQTSMQKHTYAQLKHALMKDVKNARAFTLER